MDDDEVKKNEMSTKNVMVLWDFDWSLINENSDFYVMRKLFGKEEYDKKIYPKLRADAKKIGVTVFTDLLDQFAWPKLFNDHKLDKNSFTKHLCEIPIFEENLKVIKTLGMNANIATQLVISDANTVLIETILQHHGIFPDIIGSNDIYSNPGWWDKESGVMRCKRYHSKDNPHNSILKCSLNMCKGKILDEEIMKGIKNKKDLIRIYVGDGSGDYCPITRLNESDYAFVRKKYSLERRIDDNDGIQLKCKVLKWENGKELSKCFESALPFIDFSK